MPPEAIARSEPTSFATGIIVQICVTGISSFSISLLIAAPQRVLEPQVEVRITPVTPAAFSRCGYVFTDVRRVFHGGMGAAGGMDEFVEFADHAFAFELAHGVERHQAVGIAIGDRRVVAGMNGVDIYLRRESSRRRSGSS